MKKVILLACLFFCFSCLNKESKKDKTSTLTQTTIGADTLEIAQGSYYFSGDYRTANKQATFKDCITGQIIPVSKCAAYKQISEAYHHLDLNTIEGVYCELMGFLIETPTNSSDTLNHLVVTSLIRFSRTAACHLGMITNSTYTTILKDTVEQKITLSLLPNYTFSVKSYDANSSKLISIDTGDWHRLSDENIVLLTNGEVLYQGIVNFTNLDLELYNNDKQLLYFDQE